MAGLKSTIKEYVCETPQGINDFALFLLVIFLYLRHNFLKNKRTKNINITCWNKLRYFIEKKLTSARLSLIQVIIC